MRNKRIRRKKRSYKVYQGETDLYDIFDGSRCDGYSPLGPSNSVELIFLEANKSE